MQVVCIEISAEGKWIVTLSTCSRLNPGFQPFLKILTSHSNPFIEYKTLCKNDKKCNCFDFYGVSMCLCPVCSFPMALKTNSEECKGSSGNSLKTYDLDL